MTLETEVQSATWQKLVRSSWYWFTVGVKWATAGDHLLESEEVHFGKKTRWKLKRCI